MQRAGRSRQFILVGTFLFLLPFGWAGAYPITPVTLWDLLTGSQVVVLADVGAVTDCWAKDDEDPPAACHGLRGDAIAMLRVREIWKKTESVADSDLASLLVRYEAHMICPAPPRYEPGKLVIAFLRQGGSGWETVALSYGTLYPAVNEVEVYRSLIKEAQRLQASPPVPRQAQLDWLVVAASRRATRWQGIYELLPRADSLHSSYDGDLERRTGTEGLTSEQYQALARGFAEEPSTDRTLPMFLALFEGRPSHALDRAAMGAVERLLLEDKAPWWIGEALGPLLRRLGDSMVENRLRPLGDPFDDKDMTKVRDIWKRAKTDLDLPDMPPAAMDPREVGRVGSDTPS
jgi:hypothetical protein